MYSYDEDSFTFQILPNAGLNATEVANLIEKMKATFHTRTGYEIVYVTTGEDKVNYYGIN